MYHLRRAAATMYAFVALAAAVPVSGGPAGAQGANRDRGSKEVVVAGEPTLTRGMLARVTDFIEWALEAPLTDEQRDTIQKGLTESWQKHNQSDIDGTNEILKADEQVAALTEAERAVALQQVQASVLQGLRADAKDAFNKWLLGVYDAAHAKIAEGNPPLTRQISDAQAEMFAFMSGEASGQPVTPDRQFKEDWAKRLTQQWPALPVERQAQWAQSPVIWASLRVIWARSSEEERASLRKSWAESLPGAVPQVKERAKVETSLKDVAGLLDVTKERPLTATEAGRAAADVSVAAEGLRKAGGDEGKQRAAELELTAEELKARAAAREDAEGKLPAAPASPTSKAPASGRQTDAAIIQKVASQHDRLMSSLNAALQSQCAKANDKVPLGGSSYRYTNGYGKPG